MGVQILQGDCRDMLRTLPDAWIHCCVTSPPYWGLRAYGTEAQVWGADPICEHEWIHQRYYTTSTAGKACQDAFSEAGAANAQRLKEGRWREDDTCARCGAWRGELGLEPAPEMYVRHLVEVFREVRRVLRGDGTLWLNLGDSYASDGKSGGTTGGKHRKDLHGEAGPGRNRSHTGLKDKDLVGIPWRVAFALQADGWYLRSDIIWAKPNPMPESVADRPTKSHEYLFLLSRSEKYYYDADAIREPHTSMDRPPGNKDTRIKGRISGNSLVRPTKERSFPAGGRNRRSVWTIPTKPYAGAHFATFPTDLVAPCIQAGTSEWGCCPRCGAPHLRVVQKGEALEEQRAPRGADRHGEYHGTATMEYPSGKAQDASAFKAGILAGMVERGTIGWQASCECLAEDTVPCRVLDPFGGSGTVGEVATQHGCDCVLVELNPRYVNLARDRNRQRGLFSP